jgi:hypothetical protein
MADGTAAVPTGEPSAAFLKLVLDSDDVGTFLRSVMGQLMEELGGASRGISWAITVLRPGTTGTWAADSALAAAVDALQHSFDDGPALTAIRCGEFVHVADVGVDRRWPGYASAAAGYGVLSLLSVPLVSEGVFAATVNLYAPLPHSFTSTDITTVRSYTRQGMRGLRLATQLAARTETHAGLVPGPGSRDLVASALRFLMTEYGLSYEAAFHYLQTAARSRAAELEQAALEIFIAGSPPSPSPDTRNGTDAPAAASMKATPARRTFPHRGRTA